MPFNKVHEILDDAASFPYLDKSHLTRAGLMLNTIDKSIAVPLSETDCEKLTQLSSDLNSLSMEKARELGPVVLQFDGERDDKGRFIIAILVVPMMEVDQIHCYPYSNNNEMKKLWPYDKHFMMTGMGNLGELKVQARNTHPLAANGDLGEEGMRHMSSLSVIVTKFLIALQQGSAEIVKEDTDYSKLNKKRKAQKRNAIQPDYLLEWK